jgi:hypothetical protein
MGSRAPVLGALGALLALAGVAAALHLRRRQRERAAARGGEW